MYRLHPASERGLKVADRTFWQCDAKGLDKCALLASIYLKLSIPSIEASDQ